ncbi:Protein deglycase DJ-1zDJ-1, partial [Coelomomyces lativittatus]
MVGPTPTALVIITDGTEEMEAVIIIDVLRRGQLHVKVAGLNGSDWVTCSRQVKLLPDVALSSVQHQVFDLIVLPGGLVAAKAYQQ